MGIPFDEKEMTVVGTMPESRFMPELPVYDYPCSDREAMLRMYQGDPIWMPLGGETRMFDPCIVPDFVARGSVRENLPFNAATEGGGKDMFGIEWTYVVSARGSMEVPGQPQMEDANDWREFVKFPDVDSWDWEGCAARNNGTYLDDKKFNKVIMFTGWFERLISFMGFENAAVAMIDEDQQDAVKELFDALSDTYIDIIEHFCKHFPLVDCFCIHDDSGSQLAPFYSADVMREVTIPAMKKVTDRIHELGKYADLHSCGYSATTHIENFIAAGWDSWDPQQINPTADIFDKYGDQIILAVPIEKFPEGADEATQREVAEAYVKRMCSTPGKMAMVFGFDEGRKPYFTPTYREVIYKESRKCYDQWNK